VPGTRRPSSSKSSISATAGCSTSRSTRISNRTAGSVVIRRSVPDVHQSRPRGRQRSIDDQAHSRPYPRRCVGGRAGHLERGASDLLAGLRHGQRWPDCRVDDAGHVYPTVGLRNFDQGVQDLTLPCGKIHRLHDDGRMPDDHPFVGLSGAVRSIWSYGHRNPHGLVFNLRTHDLWSSEHGPRGGDEINLILARPELRLAAVFAGSQLRWNSGRRLEEARSLIRPREYRAAGRRPDAIAGGLELHLFVRAPRFPGGKAISSSERAQPESCIAWYSSTIRSCRRRRCTGASAAFVMCKSAPTRVSTF